MLEHVEIFKELPETILCRLEASSILLEPPDRSHVFVQGDRADFVYAIVSGDGQIYISAADRNSKSLMVEVFRKGELFGEIGVIECGTRTADAVVDGRVRLLRISGPAFLDALGQAPELGAGLCRVLARRLRRTFALFQAATFEHLEVRLARQLLYLADLSGRPSALGIRLAGRFRQADLADLLGATPRSIITILNDWRVQGLVAYDPERGLLTLSNEPAMRRLIQGGEPD